MNAQTPVTRLRKHLLLERERVVLLVSSCTRVALNMGLTHYLDPGLMSLVPVRLCCFRRLIWCLNGRTLRNVPRRLCMAPLEMLTPPSTLTVASLRLSLAWELSSLRTLTMTRVAEGVVASGDESTTALFRLTGCATKNGRQSLATAL